MLIFYCRAILPDFIPQVGMEFGSSDEAGAFGFVMVGTEALKLEKGTQTKGSLMARLHHVNLFVQMRVIE